MINASNTLPTTSGNIFPVKNFDVDGDPTPAAVETSQQSAAKEEKTNARGLTPEEQERLERLKKRDREVRRHEQAHLRAAGSLAQGGAQFEFVRGPDGNLYAVNGSVSLDTSKEDSPEENLEKGKKITRAAMAPADPSAEDLQVAAKGRRMQMEARQKLSQQRSEELINQNSNGTTENQAQNDLIKQANEIYDALTGNIQTPQLSNTLAVG